MNFIGIIPARFASTRFPGKPLTMINGKSMIQRVYEQAKKTNILISVVVATDDSRIEDHVKNFGGEVIMTSPECKNGTERCFEAILKYQKIFPSQKFDVVINIQGDEPFIHPEQIESISSCFKNEKVEIATLIKKIKSVEELENPSEAKVIINTDKQAIYFSRSVIPFYRGVKNDEAIKLHSYYKQIGMYAYRTDILKEIIRLNPTPLETAESLEQLRWLENGYKINVEFTEHESIAIDTPEDLLTINQQSV